MTRIYVKDFWGDRDLILADSSDGKIIAIGEKIEENAERFLHFKREDFLKFVEEITKEKSINSAPNGCGKYVGLAFDTDNVKIYCGDEIWGGEKRGFFIKLCDKCRKKQDKKLNEQRSRA